MASPPSDPLVEFYIERLPDGEVSGFLADGLAVGDAVQIRGPIGGWFVWDGQSSALGLGGGTGVVPLVAMLRHARAVGRSGLLRLVAAARTVAQLPYAEELIDAGAVLALSREARGDRPAGRLAAADLAAADLAAADLAAADLSGWTDPAPDDGPVFVCGSSGFAEAASSRLIEFGIATTRIRVERFGPSG